MILVSVGTQLPFDRLIKAVDLWALKHSRDDVVAQVGPSTYTPEALRCFSMQRFEDFRSLQQQAEIHVAHAGMGSILTALELGKPLVILPRDHTRGEHRNGHQIATARRFEGHEGIHVVWEEYHLEEVLNRLCACPQKSTPSSQPPDIVNRLRKLVEGW